MSLREVFPAFTGLFAALTLLAPTARAASAGLLPIEHSAVTLTWDDNLSNSDRDSDRIDGLMAAMLVDGSTRRSLAHGNSLTLGVRLQYETAWDYRRLGLGTFGGTLGGDHKFGIGPFAPVAGVTLGLDTLAASETDRIGLQALGNLHARFRLGNATVAEVRGEFTRRGARNAVFDGSAREGIVLLTQDAGEPWQFTATLKARQGDVVSYANPPRPDLVAEAGSIASLDTFGTARTAYTLDARSLAGGLSVAYRAGSGLTFSAGYEDRDTRRGTLRYRNHRWLFSVGRPL
jgi:hypothetical protein